MFIPARAAVVDKSPQSVLIRGNMPLVGPDNRYAYSEIGEAVGVDLSGYKRFISVSLIDNTGERANWERELRSFGADPDAFPAASWPPYLCIAGWNPQLKLGSGLSVGQARVPGSLVWWPIEGLAPGDDPQVFLRKPGWDLVGLTGYLVALYMVPGSAVFFHCTLGADRTGALHAAYLMARHNLSTDEALGKVAAATAAGAPSVDYQRLAHAYGRLTR